MSIRSATRSPSGRARWAATPGVQGRPISVAGAAGAIKTLSAGGQNAALPQISINGINGVAVWTRLDGTNARVQAAAVSSTGGEAVAVWSHPDDVSSHQRIQASVGP